MSHSEPPSSAQLEKARRVVHALLERRAREIVALDVRELTSFADTFVLATGGSSRQVKAAAEAVVKASKQAGEVPLGVEGEDDARWVLIDLADTVVHVFLPDLREHYDLDRLWADAPELDVGADGAGREPEPEASAHGQGGG